MAAWFCAQFVDLTARHVLLTSATYFNCTITSRPWIWLYGHLHVDFNSVMAAWSSLVRYGSNGTSIYYAALGQVLGRYLGSPR